MSARDIAVPSGTDIRLCIRAPHHSVVVAPAPLKADLDALLSEPNVVALFTFDDDLSWPDREGCRWASTYLSTGHAVILQFNTLKDALAAQKRLAASLVTP